MGESQSDLQQFQEFANSSLAMETVQEGRGEGKGDTKSELKVKR